MAYDFREFLENSLFSDNIKMMLSIDGYSSPLRKTLTIESNVSSFSSLPRNKSFSFGLLDTHIYIKFNCPADLALLNLLTLSSTATVISPPQKHVKLSTFRNLLGLGKTCCVMTKGQKQMLLQE